MLSAECAEMLVVGDANNACVSFEVSTSELSEEERRMLEARLADATVRSGSAWRDRLLGIPLALIAGAGMLLYRTSIPLALGVFAVGIGYLVVVRRRMIRAAPGRIGAKFEVLDVRAALRGGEARTYRVETDLVVQVPEFADGADVVLFRVGPEGYAIFAGDVLDRFAAEGDGNYPARFTARLAGREVLAFERGLRDALMGEPLDEDGRGRLREFLGSVAERGAGEDGERPLVPAEVVEGDSAGRG